MPKIYGSVLVVDDVEINLIVMKSMLNPYSVAVETASSGFDALRKIERGNIYDIIFMDHMMPKLDGMQTTVKIRTTGYKDPIIALTALTRADCEKKFTGIGFDDFLTKPVNPKQLDEVLTKYIIGVKSVAAEPALPEINPFMIEAFLRDAKKAITTIRATIKANDILLFTTTVHAMKAALGNICEKEAAMLADTLETAGHDNNTTFIAENSENFIKRLEALVEQLESKQQPGTANDAQIEEDTAFLAQQMQIVKTACEDYDDTAAYSALDILKAKPWNAATAAAIDEIHRTLMLKSDFDEAAEMAGRFCER